MVVHTVVVRVKGVRFPPSALNVNEGDDLRNEVSAPSALGVL